MRSSLGFHTIELSLTLPRQQSFKLREDLIAYSRKTGRIKIYSYDQVTKIFFHNNDRGIQWRIIPKGNFEDSTDILFVKINPKVLGGDIDYITAATYNDMNVAIHNFNLISEEISPIMQSFSSYTINRVDYCVNFCIDELVPDCSPELIMNLIKRSDIPPHYTEWAEYDLVAHRMKSKENSFYLINRATNINCYLKHDELLDRVQEDLHVPQSALKDSEPIIRFEVQCKRRKLYDIIEKIISDRNDEVHIYNDLLSPPVCNSIISHYFFDIVGRGDWFSFTNAVNKIDSYKFNSQKRNRLVEALRIVSRCRSVYKAKALFQGNESESFSRTLKELFDIGINPVTIPQEWGRNHIANLLDEFYKKINLERSILSLDNIQKDDPSTFKRLMRGM